MSYLTHACACGGSIFTDGDNPGPGLDAHYATPEHMEWRMSQDAPAPLPRLTVGPLTVDRLAELGLLPKATPRAITNSGYRRR